MKVCLTIFCLCFIAWNSFSQDWEKDLRTARKLYKEKKYEESLKHYKSAQKTAPKNIDLSDEVGQASYRANEFEKAEKVFNSSKSKKGKPQQQAKTYHNIGNSKMKQKKYAEAVEAYKEALRKNPNDDETRYNLSEALKQQKNQEKNNKDQKDKNQQKPPQNQKPPQKPQDQKDQDKQNDQKDKQDPADKPKQENQNKSGNQEAQKSKLSDKKTERMLDDLQKKEMETKKKLDKNKGKSSNNSSGKDW